MARLSPSVIVRFVAADTAPSVAQIEAWAHALSQQGAAGRRIGIALASRDEQAVDPEHVAQLQATCRAFAVDFRHVRLPADSTLAAAAAALDIDVDDYMVLADPADVPSPDLAGRLLEGFVDSNASIVAASTLPLASLPANSEVEDNDLTLNCVMLSGHVARELGDFTISDTTHDISQVIRRASGLGLHVALAPSAFVFQQIRVDAELHPCPAATLDTEPSAADGQGNMPASHPADLETTSLGDLIRATGSCPRPAEPAGTATPSCFLTVITRTQGTRLHLLEEMLLCLAAQTVRDFEVILAQHRVEAENRAQIQEIVERFPEWLQSRIRTIDVERPGRAAPLNDALELAGGRYAVVLDDDDTVFSHWVETFRELESQAPGRVLRAVALRQDVAQTDSHGRILATPLGPPFFAYPLAFEFIDHLHVNASPCMSVAFPRGVFDDLHYRFNESMAATEDWEYLVRAASVVGVKSTPEVTSVYRYWLSGGSSRSVESSEDWDRGQDIAYRSFDERIMLLPRGSARRVRELFERNAAAWAEVKKAVEAHDALAEEYRRTSEVHEELGREYERTSDMYLRMVEQQQRTNERARSAERQAKGAERELQVARKQLRRQRKRANRRLSLMRELDELLSSRAAGRQGRRPTLAEQRADIFYMTIAELEERITEVSAGRQSSTAARRRDKAR